MNLDDKWLKKELDNVSKEQEDRAWAKKRAEYGEKFNAAKFYELDSLSSKLFGWFWILLFIGIPLFFTLKKAYEVVKANEAMIEKTKAEHQERVEKSLWR